MSNLKLESVEQFSNYFEELSEALLQAGFVTAATELKVRSKAYEVPMTGYYGGVYLCLEKIIEKHHSALPLEIKERVKDGYFYCFRLVNPPH